jgi:hypothetical protein
MQRDLQIHAESESCLRAELSYAAAYLQSVGHVECEVLFGWAWLAHPSGSDLSWRSVRIPIVRLDAEVECAEAAGLGRFRRDDVHLMLDGGKLELLFCHHSGIHIKYDQPDNFVEHFFTRWQSAGLSPLECEKTDDPTKWRLIRGYLKAAWLVR